MAYLDEELWNACGSGEDDLAINLLDQGANINARDHEHGMTPLMAAAWFGHVNTLVVLLKNGAIVNDVSKAGAKENFGKRTALHFVCERACEREKSTDIEIIDHLLRWGADPSMVDVKSTTPIDLARVSKLPDSAIELLEMKCSVLDGDLWFFDSDGSEKKVHMEAVPVMTEAGATSGDYCHDLVWCVIGSRRPIVILNLKECSVQLERVRNSRWSASSHNVHLYLVEVRAPGEETYTFRVEESEAEALDLCKSLRALCGTFDKAAAQIAVEPVRSSRTSQPPPSRRASSVEPPKMRSGSISSRRGSGRRGSSAITKPGNRRHTATTPPTHRSVAAANLANRKAMPGSTAAPAGVARRSVAATKLANRIAMPGTAAVAAPAPAPAPPKRKSSGVFAAVAATLFRRSSGKRDSGSCPEHHQKRGGAPLLSERLERQRLSEERHAAYEREIAKQARLNSMRIRTPVARAPYNSATNTSPPRGRTASNASSRMLAPPRGRTASYRSSTPRTRAATSTGVRLDAQRQQGGSVRGSLPKTGSARVTSAIFEPVVPPRKRRPSLAAAAHAVAATQVVQTRPPRRSTANRNIRLSSDQFTRYQRESNDDHVIYFREMEQYYTEEPEPEPEPRGSRRWGFM